MSKRIVVVGSLNLDLVAAVPRNPAPGETLSASGMERHVGGKGANQAAAAALAGGDVLMVGRHGTDGFETMLLDVLRDKGVDLSGVTAAEGPSGVALILVTPDGQNSIVIVPGANAALCAGDIDLQHAELSGAALILTQLETPLASLEATVDLAAKENVPVMLDPAPARPLSRELLQRVTWLTPNESEAAALTGAAVPQEQEKLHAFVESLLALGPRNVVLKLGRRGVFVATQCGERAYVPAKDVKAIDSTAAGDAFNGAFAVALAEGADPVEAVRFAVAAASLSVTRPGAISSLPARAEIEAFRSASVIGQG